MGRAQAPDFSHGASVEERVNVGELVRLKAGTQFIPPLKGWDFLLNSSLTRHFPTMFDDYSPHICINGKRIRMGRGMDGSWVRQTEETHNRHVQPMSWKNGDEEDASRIRELLQDGQEPITEIANRLGIGFRRVERLLNLLLATGDVEVLREGNGQQWRIS